MKAHLTDLSRQSHGTPSPAGAAPRCLALIALALCLGRPEVPAADTNAPGWLTEPMSLNDAIKMALKQNGSILMAESDLEASHGAVVQTRSIGLPQVRGAAAYEHTEAFEKIPFDNEGRVSPQRDSWSGSLRVVQTVYEGGRVRSARRTADLTTERALLLYQTVVADTLFAVRTAYHDTLLAEQQILVQESSVKILVDQLDITRRRFDAGAVPRFDVLRGEVELANARPRLIRAKNAYRIAKNNVATVLGYNIPTTIWEDIPMTLSGKLEAEPYSIELPIALAQAVVRRSELGALIKEQALRKEGVTAVRSTLKPALGVFAAYGAHNSAYSDNFMRDVAGPTAGIELKWNIWDGSLTRGRVMEAQALLSRSRAEYDDAVRKVELEVRTAFSSFQEAREILESQKKVQEQAEETLRLAVSRYEAGTGTQLDLLNAQTALTEARTTQIEALHRYAIARARLQRATGQDNAAEPAGGAEKAPPPKE